jgi:hypothetical protein
MKVATLCALAALGAAFVSVTEAAFAPCCAYGGSGGGVAFGSGVLNAFAPPPNSPSNNPLGPSYSAPMALGISTSKSFSTILFAAASGPEDARAGWIVTSNATNDVIYVFANVSSTGPTCAAGVAPRGEMVSAYRFCGGRGGLFKNYVSDYLLTPATRVGVFNNAGPPSFPVTTMTFADEKACAPTTLIGAESPFGTGAFSIAFQSGVAEEPPSTWSQPPSWCNGKWLAM